VHDVLTTSEAVRQFQMHPATVLRLILTQRVTAHKDANGKWLIRRSDLERWKSSARAQSVQARAGSSCIFELEKQGT
jgi:excisionase family DNA binding protein